MPVRRRGARKPRVARKGRKPARRLRVPRGINDHGQMATIKETVEFVDLSPNLGYNFNFNLSQFIRASALAPNFKFYKAKSVEWTVEPLYNTFQDGTTGGEVTIPYMYMTMNRTQDSTGIILKDIQAMGAKPQKLVGKKTIKYVPNWCSPGLSVYNVGSYMASTGLQKQFDYLACPNTNSGQNVTSQFVPAIAPGSVIIGQVPIYANQTVYNGHTIWIDQEVPTGTLQSVARVTCTVTWHFKDPHFTEAPQAETYVTVVPASQAPPCCSPAPPVL